MALTDFHNDLHIYEQDERKKLIISMFIYPHQSQRYPFL